MKNIWYLTIHTGKNLCFTEFSTKIYWNTRLAASDVFYMFTQSVNGPIIWRFSNRALNFNLLNRIEISSRLNSKLLFKMTFKLHVKIPTRYAELKFQLSLAKPRWNSTRNEISNSPYNWYFFQPGMKIWYYTHVNSLFIFKKIKTTTSKARFKRTDDKLINFMLWNV